MNYTKYLPDQLNPITRFLARFLDYCFFYALCILPFFFTSLIDNDLIHCIAISIIPLVWVPVEALLTYLFSTTPGKFLFGIFIRGEHGKKLSLKQAFTRSFKVWFKGLGANIPFLNLFMFGKSFIQIKNEGRLDIDKDCLTHIYQKKRRRLRSTIASSLIALFSTFFVAEYEIREAIISSNTKKELVSNEIKITGVDKKWNAYKDPEGAFVISFPGNPDESFVNIPIPKTKDSLPYHSVNFKLDDHDIEYTLHYTTLPKNWLKWKPSLLLKGALKLICSKLSQGRIIDKTFSTLQNLPTLHFTLEKPDNKESVGRLILIDNVLYKLEVVYPKEQKAQAEQTINTFLESFKPSM